MVKYTYIQYRLVLLSSPSCCVFSHAFVKSVCMVFIKLLRDASSSIFCIAETGRGFTICASVQQRLNNIPYILGCMYATALLQGGSNPTIFTVMCNYLLGVDLGRLQEDLTLEDIPAGRGLNLEATLKSVR